MESDMNLIDQVHKFRLMLPTVRGWIEYILEENKDQAVPVITLAFPQIEKTFPPDFLRTAKVVVVTGKVPFPPLSLMGLNEFSWIEHMPIAGITYMDTFFVSCLQRKSESLHFHELVHVAQWERLGVDNFLLAYGIGLMQDGYQHSPLEKMAYSLQEAFDRGGLHTDVMEVIQRKSDVIWNGIASMLSPSNSLKAGHNKESS
jgi:hypothetical protein